MLASPVITSATTVTVSGTGINNATVELYRASRPAGQSGLPTAYLGSAVVAGGSWSINVSLSTGDRVTALQIAANNNTSMLSTNVAASFQAPPPAPVANFSWLQQSGNRTVNFTDTSTNTPTSWSWNFGDGGSSTAQNPNHTYASAGNYQVALTATNGGGQDTRTLTVQVSDPVVGQYVIDTFGRTSTNSWGSTNPGGAYTLNGTAADFDVANGVGTMNVPTGGAMRTALLNSVSAQDVDLLVRVSVDKAPAGGAYFLYGVVRRNGTNEYRPKIRFRADGIIAVQASRVVANAETPLGNEVAVSGLAPTPGSFIWLRAQVTGTSPTTISVKAWADGQAEPSSWQFTATDSTAGLQTAGGAGLRAYIGGNVSTAPVKFTFDDFSVVAP
jgi:PKD repeat protein